MLSLGAPPPSSSCPRPSLLCFIHTDDALLALCNSSGLSVHFHVYDRTLQCWLSITPELKMPVCSFYRPVVYEKDSVSVLCSLGVGGISIQTLATTPAALCCPSLSARPSTRVPLLVDGLLAHDDFTPHATLLTRRRRVPSGEDAFLFLTDDLQMTDGSSVRLQRSSSEGVPIEVARFTKTVECCDSIGVQVEGERESVLVLHGARLEEDHGVVEVETRRALLASLQSDGSLDEKDTELASEEDDGGFPVVRFSNTPKVALWRGSSLLVFDINGTLWQLKLRGERIAWRRMNGIDLPSSSLPLLVSLSPDGTLLTVYTRNEQGKDDVVECQLGVPALSRLSSLLLRRLVPLSIRSAAAEKAWSAVAAGRTESPLVAGVEALMAM